LVCRVVSPSRSSAACVTNILSARKHTPPHWLSLPAGCATAVACAADGGRRAARRPGGRVRVPACSGRAGGHLRCDQLHGGAALAAGARPPLPAPAGRRQGRTVMRPRSMHFARAQPAAGLQGVPWCVRADSLTPRTRVVKRTVVVCPTGALCQCGKTRGAAACRARA
jgi:hypothetical protein